MAHKAGKKGELGKFKPRPELQRCSFLRFKRPLAFFIQFQKDPPKSPNLFSGIGCFFKKITPYSL